MALEVSWVTGRAEDKSRYRGRGVRTVLELEPLGMKVIWWGWSGGCVEGKKRYGCKSR